MSIWLTVRTVLGSGTTAFGAVVDRIGTLFAGDPAVRRQVAFSIAMVALSAKMAKADGVVTSDEVAAFRGLFAAGPHDERMIGRLFDLAKRDTAGFESYAAKIAGLYGADRQGLEDVMDGLFAIARADGAVHEAEIVYLERVAAIFGIVDGDFERILARHVVPEEGDPYLILGVERSMGLADVRRSYRRLVQENHPDRLIARGLPAEAIALANDRLAAINRAFERIEAERRV